MSRKLHSIALILLTQFLYVQVAEAVLVRNSGRGERSGNYDEGYYYVDNRFVNSLGITDAGMASYSNLITRGVGGGGRALGSVPSDCVNGYTDDEVDDLNNQRYSAQQALESQLNRGEITGDEYDAGIIAIDNDFDSQIQAKTVGTPCVWEFDFGEDLFTFGFFSLDFGTPDVSYSVNWQIRGGGNFWNLAGTVENGLVVLNTAAPSDLFAGDYTITTEVSYSSSKGTFFYDRTQPGNEVKLQRVCDLNPEYDAYYAANGPYEIWEQAYQAWEATDRSSPAPIQPPEPDFEICGTAGISENTDMRVDPDQYFYSGYGEALRILPVSTDPKDPVNNPVNAPASIAMLLLGLAGLVLRRNKKS